MNSRIQTCPNIDQLLRYGTVSDSVIKNYTELLHIRQEFCQKYPNEYKDFQKRYNRVPVPVSEAGKKDGQRTPLFNHIWVVNNSPCYGEAINEYWYLYAANLVYSKIKESESERPKNFSSTVYYLPSSEKSDKKPVNLAATIHSTYPKQTVQPSSQHGSDEYKTLKEENQRLHRMLEEHGQEIIRLQKQEKDNIKTIDELRNRISGFASRQLTEGNPNFADLGDKNRPTNLGQRFHAIYDDEWTSAIESLTKKKTGRLSEDEAMFLLTVFLQEIYEFCVKIADDQISSMVMNIVEPCAVDSTALKQSVKSYEKIAKEVRDIRRKFNEEPTLHIIEKFKSTSKHLKPHQNDELIIKYTEKCIANVWLMRTHDPPMVLKWPKQGDKFDNNLYNHYSKKGSTVSIAVWPVVLLHEGGTPIHKGYAKPL